MTDNRGEFIGENKQYIEGVAHEISGELELAGLKIEWGNAQDTMGTYKLKIHCPGYPDPLVISFSANSLRWKTYYPDPDEDVEVFLKDEEELQPDSYTRKKQWKEKVRKGLKGFCKSKNPIGFRN